MLLVPTIRDSRCPQVSDVQDALGVVRSIPIVIRGEAYKIEVSVKYPQVTGHDLCKSWLLVCHRI